MVSSHVKHHRKKHNSDIETGCRYSNFRRVYICLQTELELARFHGGWYFRDIEHFLFQNFKFFEKRIVCRSETKGNEVSRVYGKGVERVFLLNNADHFTIFFSFPICHRLIILLACKKKLAPSVSFVKTIYFF